MATWVNLSTDQTQAPEGKKRQPLGQLGVLKYIGSYDINPVTLYQ